MPTPTTAVSCINQGAQLITVCQWPMIEWLYGERATQNTAADRATADVHAVDFGGLHTKVLSRLAIVRSDAKDCALNDYRFRNHQPLLKRVKKNEYNVRNNKASERATHGLDKERRERRAVARPRTGWRGNRKYQIKSNQFICQHNTEKQDLI